MKNTVIIGGGLAGLSAGYHLREHEPTVFERETEIGGLCRSFTQDGFTFDCTGHLIHLRNQYTKELIARILPDAFQPHERLASIYSKSVTTPYPFQANTYGLPPEVVKECVVGFVESMQSGNREAPKDFHDWTMRTFGSGIAKHFMLPYNEKFWKQDLHSITAEWVSWSIPKPTLEEVVNGALGLTNKGMGYNPRFIYPKDGGIDCLPRAFAASIANIYSGQSVEHIDPKRKVVRLAGGREEQYDSLISTLPLPVIFRMLGDTPDGMRQDAEKLNAVSVLNFNIGVDRPGISNQHWIYFPEDQFIFSRVGFPANFSSSVAPAGTSSIYIEITHPSRSKPNFDEAFDRSIADLQRCGILRPDDRILTRHMLDIEYAYVVFDAHRQAKVQKLIEYLESRDIFAAGRYGRWEYFSMEDSILSGKTAAELVRKRASTIRVLA
ncbi:MAG TPA: FAD-dependent oxidoreductase [Terriglobia bacterium]|nr:FAD-dependent oxidoreductase [Terriglobia bacterium]